MEDERIIIRPAIPADVVFADQIIHEMESSAIYGLGKSLGHHCISLNAIVANRIVKEFTKDGAMAVENLIVRSLEIIADSDL